MCLNERTCLFSEQTRYDRTYRKLKCISSLFDNLKRAYMQSMNLGIDPQTLPPKDSALYWQEKKVDREARRRTPVKVPQNAGEFWAVPNSQLRKKLINQDSDRSYYFYGAALMHIKYAAINKQFFHIIYADQNLALNKVSKFERH